MAAEQAAPPPAAGALLHVAVVIDHYGDDESLPLHRCRICFEQDEDEALVDLSCLCKGELSKVHASCGNAWFKRRGAKARLLRASSPRGARAVLGTLTVCNNP